jgi:glycosyltransferase involved in cell wall biosynthesis
MTEPLVSCLCCTYSRPVLLGESIKCFLDQDYPNKELIVLNDQEGVELFLQDCPSNVKIINHPTRFNSLGEKRNYIKTLGKGEFFCVWDDDDLFTPFRLSESVYLILQNSQHDILKPKDAFISIDNESYKVATNRFHTQAIIKREYMEKTQYPLKSIGEDAAFERGANIGIIDIFPSFWAILRYGMNIYHISQIHNSLEKRSWEIAGNKSNLKGKIMVEPKFQKQYWEEMRRTLNNINGFWGEELVKKIGKI